MPKINQALAETMVFAHKILWDSRRIRVAVNIDTQFITSLTEAHDAAEAVATLYPLLSAIVVNGAAPLSKATRLHYDNVVGVEQVLASSDVFLGQCAFCVLHNLHPHQTRQVTEQFSHLKTTFIHTHEVEQMPKLPNVVLPMGELTTEVMHKAQSGQVLIPCFAQSSSLMSALCEHRISPIQSLRRN